MLSYSIRYRDTQGVTSTESIEARDDLTAVERAHARLSGRMSLFEIWQGDRLAADQMAEQSRARIMPDLHGHATISESIAVQHCDNLWRNVFRTQTLLNASREAVDRSRETITQAPKE